MKFGQSNVVSHPMGDDYATAVNMRGGAAEQFESESVPHSRRKKIFALVAGVACVAAGVIAVIATTSSSATTSTDSSGAVNSENAAIVDPVIARSTKYQGCWIDGWVDLAGQKRRVLEHRVRLDETKTTVEECIVECGNLGYKYSGVQYGKECYCGNNHNKLGVAPEEECNMMCPQETGQICGGFLRNSVYATDKALLNTEYRGCWVDGYVELQGQQRRVLEHRVRLDETKTDAATCIRECSSLGYKFSGLQYGKECWCGNNHDKIGRAPEKECNMVCSGNLGEVCGGFLRTSVFANVDQEPVTPGFAAGVTGGGDATPVYPKDIAELKAYLGDSSPRVIMLDKEFNFIGTEGSVTEEGCRPSHHLKCVGRGQDSLVRGVSCTDGEEKVQVTYDKAGVSGLTVRDNKTILGVGTKGVIVGKGLKINGKNIIIQNIHITNLNPHIIWGGDGIQVWGDKDASGNLISSDLIWIDHVKISLVGRQMVAVGFGGSGRMTLSNNEFDGVTQWSSSCDNKHYWTILLYGLDVRLTMVGNKIHNTSGRGPKVGGQSTDKVLVHAVNNYWLDNSGHDFDVATNGYVLAEGNLFENSKQPRIGTTGSLFAPSSANAAECSALLGRACVENAFVSSGAMPTSDAEKNAVLSTLKLPYALPAHSAADSKGRAGRSLKGEQLSNFGTTPLY